MFHFLHPSPARRHVLRQKLCQSELSTLTQINALRFRMGTPPGGHQLRRPYSFLGDAVQPSSPASQPLTSSIFSGSGPSQSKHWNVRFPLPPGGSARIRNAPQPGQVGRSAWPMAKIYADNFLLVCPVPDKEHRQNFSLAREPFRAETATAFFRLLTARTRVVVTTRCAHGWRRPTDDGDPLQSVCKVPVEGVRKCGDRATAPIEGIWCEKIRGCSYREAVRPPQCPLCPDSDQILRRREMTRCAKKRKSA